MASPVRLKVAPGPRGGGEQNVRTIGGIQSCDLTWSWGARPASGVLVYPGPSFSENSSVIIESPITNDAVTGAPVPPGSFCSFFGIAKKVVSVISSEGRVTTVEFVDMRELLSWDHVWGFYNRRIDLLVDGVWQKYYSHLLPENVATNFITYTPGPYTAAQILDFIFTSPTVNSTWFRIYYPVQVTDYVYNIDCTSGRTVADVVTEISQRQGLVFTLLGGQWQLVWALKGQGYLPVTFGEFPANSDHQRLGTAISEKPDTVTIVGGRNRYQVLGIPMVPDWNQTLISPSSAIGSDYAGFDFVFVSFVYNQLTDPLSGQPYAHMATAADPANYAGNSLARARAETITLGELADIFDANNPGSGEAYRDRRKYNGRTRLDIPVLGYVKLLIGRAFSLPPNFGVTTIYGATIGTPGSIKIVPVNLVETTYNYVTGAMTAIPLTVPGGNGLAIVQGLGFFNAPPVAWRSDQFDLTAWQNTHALWQRAPFQIDDTGDQTQFIIFDIPVFVSDNLLVQINGHGVLNKNATFKIPNVLASLTIEAEQFLWYQVGGAGPYADLTGVNGTENVADLQSDFVCAYGVPSSVEEQPFADGETGSEKASAIADYILEQQPVYVLGGYTNWGNNGTQLSGTFDRVTLHVGADGMTETVDFTSERSGNTFEPERDFDRRIQLLQLAPGQADALMDARETWGFVASLRHTPRYAQVLLEEFHQRYGSGSPLVSMTVNTD